MNRVEDFLNAAKTNEMLGELLHIKKEEEKKQNVLMWVLIAIGAVLAVAGIAYAVYRFFTPDYLEDFDEEFDDDFDDDFFDDEEEATGVRDEEDELDAPGVAELVLLGDSTGDDKEDGELETKDATELVTDEPESTLDCWVVFVTTIVMSHKTPPKQSTSSPLAVHVHTTVAVPASTSGTTRSATNTALLTTCPFSTKHSSPSPPTSPQTLTTKHSTTSMFCVTVWLPATSLPLCLSTTCSLSHSTLGASACAMSSTSPNNTPAPMLSTATLAGWPNDTLTRLSASTRCLVH